MTWQEENEWYLTSNGFRQNDGYFFHLGHRVVITDEVVMDYEPSIIRSHIEGINPQHISLIFSSPPEREIIDDIVNRHQWMGKEVLIIPNQY